jgi:hypothetical protein
LVKEDALTNKALAIVVLLGMSMISGCSGDDSGACVSSTLPGSFQYTYCSDDWGKAECEEWEAQGEHTFHGGDTCEDLGYTYYCASTYTYHMSSSTCD